MRTKAIGRRGKAAFGRWQAFRGTNLRAVTYLTYGNKKVHEGLAMDGNDGTVRLWYPIKGGIGIDCRPLAEDEVRSMCPLEEKDLPALLEQLRENGGTLRTSPGMHPELVRKFRRTVRQFILNAN